MAKERFITGLDIGTSSIKTLITKREPIEERLELVLKSEEVSDGVRRGTVCDIEKASSIFKDIFGRSSQDLGQDIRSVYINISGSHLFSAQSHGLISVSRADQKISEEDIRRVLQEARTINLSSNKEIFEVFPKEYIVDGVKGIKNPLGLQGVRLEAEILALGGFSPYLQNTRQAVLNSNLEILDIIPSPIAAARAVLTEKQKELGVALLDIGAGITSLAVFEEGSLIHFAVFPMGSANITSDIAIVLKIGIDIAEEIKIKYGSCFLKGKEGKRKIDLGEDKPLIFPQKLLVKIISDRILEIFEEVNKELKKISKERLLPAGIVLTGGGAKMHKIVELGKNKFHLPVRLGEPKGISGVNGDLRLATACGLVLMGADSETTKGGSGTLEKVTSRIRRILRNLIP